MNEAGQHTLEGSQKHLDDRFLVMIRFRRGLGESPSRERDAYGR